MPVRTELILAMQITYLAYGLQLRCSVALAGLTPKVATDGLPSIAISLVTPRELDTTWSGSDGPVEWRGQLGDGRSLTIERGLEGDLLFTYSDRARFRLDHTKLALDCAPSEEGPRWQQVLLGRILPNVALERGYEALHAGAVASPEGVIAVAAPSGTGKTTLATELMRRGWPLFTDDVLVLAADDDGVLAYPGPPLMNVAADQAGDGACDAFGQTLAVLSGERWVTTAHASDGDCPVRMVCLFERAEGLPLGLQRIPSSPLPLAPYMLGLAGGRERERERFSLYSDLMDSAELVRLTCGVGDRPGDLADLLEDAVGSPTVLAARGSS